MRDDTNCVNKKVLMSNIDYEFRTVKLRSHINCFCFVSCVDIYLHVLITVVQGGITCEAIDEPGKSSKAINKGGVRKIKMEI